MLVCLVTSCPFLVFRWSHIWSRFRFRLRHLSLCTHLRGFHYSRRRWEDQDFRRTYDPRDAKAFEPTRCCLKHGRNAQWRGQKDLHYTNWVRATSHNEGDDDILCRKLRLRPLRSIRVQGLRESFLIARWKQNYPRKRAILLPRDSFPAWACLKIWHRWGRHPKVHLRLNHEVRRRHQKRLFQTHYDCRWQHFVPQHFSEALARDQCPCTSQSSHQNYWEPRAQVLSLARRLYPRNSVHVPWHVDHEIWVWRVRSLCHPPQVLLKKEPSSPQTILLPLQRKRTIDNTRHR